MESNRPAIQPTANHKKLAQIGVPTTIRTRCGLYSTPGRDETTMAFKKRIYRTINMRRAAIGKREMRVVKQWSRLGSYMEKPAHCMDNGYIKIDMAYYNLRLNTNYRATNRNPPRFFQQM